MEYMELILMIFQIVEHIDNKYMFQLAVDSHMNTDSQIDIFPELG